MPCQIPRKPATLLKAACLAAGLAGLALPSGAQEVFDYPPLSAVGQPTATRPQILDFPALTAAGYPAELRPRILDFPALVATGVPGRQPVQIFDFPALAAVGVPAGPPVAIFDFPALTATGAAPASAPGPAPRLQTVALSRAAVSGRYLRLDSASIARDMPLTVRYAGLPGTAATLVLFYMGGPEPRRSAWHYIAASQTDGAFERKAGSLPSDTGPWLACIGFDAAARDSKARPDDFAECVDFVLAGADTLDVQPDIQLPDTPIRAGHAFTIRYSGMPAVNAEMRLTAEGATRPSASHFTSARPAGSWTVRLDRAGTYDLELFFTGDAARARLTLEAHP